MSKSSKTEALKKQLGNVVECKECGSRKHKTKEHGKKKEEKEVDEKEEKEEE